MKSNSFIINHDGTYLTHSDESSIMKGNFYDQLESCDGSNVKELVSKMRAGLEPDGRSSGRFLVNGEECYLFYTPVKYTKWLMVSVVPCRAIDVLGYLNAGTMLLVILLAMLLLVVIGYYLMKNAIEPVKQLTQLTDDITQGRFGTPVPELKHNDEITQLRDSIEEMQFTLSNYTDNAKR
jgi:methyl-accepting chemotaxis protein